LCLLLGGLSDLLGLLGALDRGLLGVPLGADERLDRLGDDLLLLLAQVVEGVDELRLEVVRGVVLGTLNVIELTVDRRADLVPVERRLDGVELRVEQPLGQLGALLELAVEQPLGQLSVLLELLVQGRADLVLVERGSDGALM
jgi:hypothetical protein